MTIGSASATAPPESPRAATIASAIPPSWPWRRTALILAGVAQLITIWALVDADPAPVLLAAAFAPAPGNLLAAVAGIGVLVAGAIGQVTGAGLFFVPALVVLAAGVVKLWREQGFTAGEGAGR